MKSLLHNFNFLWCVFPVHTLQIRCWKLQKYQLDILWYVSRMPLELLPGSVRTDACYIYKNYRFCKWEVSILYPLMLYNRPFQCGLFSLFSYISIILLHVWFYFLLFMLRNCWMQVLLLEDRNKYITWCLCQYAVGKAKMFFPVFSQSTHN